MKILVFTDNHTDQESLAFVKTYQEEVDFFICLGDITWFGMGQSEMLDTMGTFSKDIMLLHGNHEDEDELEAESVHHSNIHFTHKEVLHMNSFDFVTFGGGGFAREDPEFEQFVAEAKHAIQDKNKVILLLHQPPIDTALDIPFEEYHSGNKSIRRYIEKEQPLLVLCGHIHEGFGKVDTIGTTTLLNPGPFGAIVDLDKLYNKEEAITILGAENYEGS